MCKLKNSNSSKFKQLYWFIKYQLMSRHFYAITGPMRILPDFLIIGAKRCGTTSLYYHLPEHPCIAKSHHDSMGFFNDNFHLGLNWYRSFFPTNFYKKSLKSKFQKLLAFDVTTGYIEKEFTADNIYQTKPDMKIISILRNPVDRAYSHYHDLGVRLGEEKRTFDDAIRSELKILEEKNYVTTDYDGNFTDRLYQYVVRGIYLDHLKIWMDVYPVKQFLILKTEELEKNPSEILNGVFKFLSLHNYDKINFEEKHNVSKYEPMNEQSRKI